MFSNRRKAVLVSAAVISGALLMTACEDGDTDAGAARDSSSAAASAPASASAPVSSPASADGGESGDKGSGTTDGKTGGTDGSGVDTGNGKREPVEQSCGANDITWSTRSESQAGGYILLMAKAKSGITCYLPAALPTVAFGSDGTEAGPAEQAVGQQVKLSGGTTAYAGVNPKTTNTDAYKELDSIIVGVGNEDPNPVSLEVGTIRVDKPVVTNWHTAPADAVPFS
ncbi:DUF4232 domain-containing protein [Streptomyces sp. NRRL WC-3549]|uniref:DUF4232 domain-containing protein n=1 Tax=Streptomyces sp. NRRL WC-3549 TaxID=1463925 RepID=UPI0004C94AD1|nr:DUF4232 domain-containing protein [Streptomyces sp. NRRL WC-3549]